MSDTIRMIGGAMRVEAEVLRTISQNIANAETVGYRRQVPVARAQLQFDEMVSASQNVGMQLGAPQLDVSTDLTPATLKSTSQPLHVGLDGPGFFIVESSRGLLLTRRGDFHVAADGTLVSFAGDRVLGEGGAIQVGSTLPTISPDGAVTIDGNVVDRLRLVNVVDNTRLESLGDGNYRAELHQLEEGSDRALVRQGFLETSNVVPVNEMIQLMETVRRFEAEQRFARAYDSMLDTAITELGKTG